MVSDSAKEFLHGLKEKKSSEFLNYQDDIFYLKDNGVSIKNIHSFLIDKFQIKSSYQNLSQWIKRQNKYKKPDIKEVSESKKKSDKEESLLIKKYPNTDGGLEKHNLKDKINRPKEI